MPVAYRDAAFRHHSCRLSFPVAVLPPSHRGCFLVAELPEPSQVRAIYPLSCMSSAFPVGRATTACPVWFALDLPAVSHDLLLPVATSQGMWQNPLGKLPVPFPHQWGRVCFGIFSKGVSSLLSSVSQPCLRADPVVCWLVSQSCPTLRPHGW